MSCYKAHPYKHDHVLDENFNEFMCRYISIVKEEKLDISQPALDPSKSEIHHQITVRRRNSKVHRY